MKKTLITGLTVAFCLLGGTAAFAEVPITPYDQESSEKYIIEKYDELFEQYNGDNTAALDALLKSSDSLELVSHSETAYLNGNVIPENTRSNMSDITMTDSIIHDSDWGTYVYIGTWDWRIPPNESNLAPWDLVGFYTQNSNELRAQECILYGYNNLGSRTIYYNTDGTNGSSISSGNVQKGTDVLSGTVFWFDERNVDNGRLVVPLYYTSGSTAKIMTSYGHCWTNTDVTGIGGEVSISGVGFNVSWETGVNHWPSLATSPGVRLP